MQKHVVDLTGDFETSIYEAARKLIAEGADPEDEIETQRDGAPCMRGNIGRCAKLAVRDSPRRGLEIVPYKPFPALRSKPTASFDLVRPLPLAAE
jgi:hypothetical protein